MMIHDECMPDRWEFDLPLRKEDLAIMVGLSNERGDFGCNDCHHRTNENDQEYSTADWPNCSKELPYRNLKGFPFKRIPEPCLREHFLLGITVMECVWWSYEGICDFPCDISMPLPIKILSKAEDRFGHIKLSERNQKRVAAAMAAWREKKGYGK